MTFFITQCPHCKTSFRASVTQLESAEGMVRCGACLNVFAADDNLVPSSEIKTATAHSAPSKSPHFSQSEASGATSTLESEEQEDLIFTLDMADSLSDRIAPSISELADPVEDEPEEVDMGFSGQETTLDFSENSESSEELVSLEDFSFDSQSESETDFSAGIAIEPTQGDEPLDASLKNNSADGLSANLMTSDADNNREEFWLDESIELQAGNDSIESSDALDAKIAGREPDESEKSTELNQYNDVPEFTTPELATPFTLYEPTETKPSANFGFSAIDDDQFFVDDDAHDIPKKALSADDIAAATSVHEPLELDWQDKTPNTRSRAWRVVLTLTLCLVLAGQTAWLYRATLAQSIIARPLLEQACQWVNCTLAPLANVAAIASDSLLVRSHEEFSNALTVNLIMRNDASFAQAFPILQLRFTDTENTLVAQRLFLPHEYLPDALVQLGDMPPSSPVQINFAILDPGLEAVNYEVAFKLPE